MPRAGKGKIIAHWSEMNLRIANVTGEARGQIVKFGEQAGRAIDWVVRNRATRRKRTMAQIILAPYQFSWTNPKEPNYRRILELVGGQNAIWETSKKVVSNSQTRGDPTKGADHYLNIPLVKRMRQRLGSATPLPKWAQQGLDNDRVTMVIGDHTFFNLEG